MLKGSTGLWIPFFTPRSFITEASDFRDPQRTLLGLAFLGSPNQEIPEVLWRIRMMRCVSLGIRGWLPSLPDDRGELPNQS